MSETTLELANVEASYGPVQALRGVSLKVERGKIVTVLGANGAGKSTILKTISGILDPHKGQIRFDGEEIQGRDPDWIVRRGIGHVPEGREIFPLLTVEENLRMGAYTRRDSDGVARDIIAAMDRKRSLIYTPGMWKLVMLAIRNLPRAVMRKIEF